jgi:N-acetylneuraminate synthase
LEPEELRAMVTAIRDIEAALGDGIKRPMPSEWRNRDVARKSLVAAADIAEGELFSAANLAAKRPGNGVSPFSFWEYSGRPASQNYHTDELIHER